MRKFSFVLLWLFVFVIPFEAVLVLSGIGALGKVFGAAVLGIGIATVLWSGRLRMPILPLFLIACFSLWGLMTYYWSYNPQLTLEHSPRYVLFLVMSWLVWELARSHREQLLLMQAYVLGATITAISVIKNSVLGFAVYGERYSAFDVDLNEVGLMLVFGVSMAWYLSMKTKRKAFMLLNMVHIPLALFAVVLTASRTAFLCAVLSLGVLVWTYARLNLTSRVAASVVIAGTFLVLPAYTPESAWERISTIRSEIQYGDLNMRTYIWKKGIAEFLESPMLGVGAGAFRSAIDTYVERVAHNTYLSILVERGLIGFFFFGWLLLLVGRAIARMDFLERRVWFALVLVWAVGVSTLTFETRKVTWLLMIMAVAMSYTGRSERRRSTRPEIEFVQNQSKSKNFIV